MPSHILSLIVFQARTADRNARGMAGAAPLGDALAKHLGIAAKYIGEPEEPFHADWQQVLNIARPALQSLAQTCEQLFTARHVPLIAMVRCASSLATLPVVAHHRPGACVVWFDAHADANTPSRSLSGYLGGMVISGAAGLWDSGFGNGLLLSNLVLVGVCDVDPAEQTMIDAGALRVVAPGKDLAQRLRAAVGDRPVYIHIDCDVMEPGIVPTEYCVADGLTLDDLRACCEVLAQNEITGLELAEFEVGWTDTGDEAAPDGLIAALQPLFDAIRSFVRL